MLRRLVTLCSILLALIPLAAQAVSLAPSVIELSGARGEVIKSEISVINTKGMEQMYFLGVMNFAPAPDGGTPQFFSTKQGDALPAWIQLPFSEFRVPANSKASVPFEMAIPADIAAGGYYAAITVSEAPGDLIADNGAVVEAKTAVLVLLTVQGETVEKLELLDFAMSGQRIADSLQQSFTYRIQNQGNVHVMPSGILEIEDVFGRVVKKFDANPEQARVLPGSTRSYHVGEEKQEGFFKMLKEQMKTLAIGPMEARLTLTYGTDTSVYSEVNFWYVPWQLLVSAVIVLAVFIKLFTRRSFVGHSTSSWPPQDDRKE